MLDTLALLSIIWTAAHVTLQRGAFENPFEFLDLIVISPIPGPSYVVLFGLHTRYPNEKTNTNQKRSALEGPGRHAPLKGLLHPDG